MKIRKVSYALGADISDVEKLGSSPRLRGTGRVYMTAPCCERLQPR